MALRGFRSERATPGNQWPSFMRIARNSSAVRLMDDIVTDCSSTAAMVVILTLTSETLFEIVSVEVTTPVIFCWIPRTEDSMFLKAAAACLAKSLTALATTAKPLPASPARADSMVASRASRLVWSASSWITSTSHPVQLQFRFAIF